MRLDNGSFGYDENNYILENVDFTLSMESWVALLGKNGCGKTTLINILLEHVNLNTGSFYKDSKIKISHFS